MPTIKVNASGIVLLKDGKPSCSCCEECAGLWGPGYDDFPDIVNVTVNAWWTGSGDPDYTADRVTKCTWEFYSSTSTGYWSDLITVMVIYKPMSGLWQSTVYLDITPPRVTLANSVGYKPGSFADGPLGDYHENEDGTGTVYLTVS